MAHEQKPHFTIRLFEVEQCADCKFALEGAFVTLDNKPTPVYLCLLVACNKLSVKED